MKNNNTQIDKKIFIAGKVYDLQVMDKDTVEASVQTYLDNADPTKDIMDADAFMITAHEYEGFMMPVPFPTLPVPGFGYPYHISQTDFLDAYRKSARILGASRIKNASLDIAPQSIVLRVQIG